MSMSTSSPDAAAPGGKQIARMAVRFAILILLLPIILFVTAGRADWPMGWAYIGITLLATVLSRVLVARRNPDLLLERATAERAGNVKGWDRILVPVVALYGPLAMLIVAGLSQRFGWMPRLPVWMQWVGLAGVAFGSTLSVWAMVTNRFFSAYVRIQTERGQTAVSSGPYRYVRHPAYAGGVILDLALPFMLDAAWALVPGLLLAATMVVRTALEDRTLIAELAGYAEYTRRVHYRLIPGLW
jgi:protein-S-isoprenylcysteine O-methyltransferase Ste14